MKKVNDARLLNPVKKPWIELEYLKNLIDLMKDTDVSEVEIEKGGVRVRVKKTIPSASFGLRKIHEAISAALPAGPPAKAIPDQPSELVEDKYHTVCSPIVGTFYRSPSPDKEPYVNVGDNVKKGQILCIIEAMKLMNEIESEVDGKMVEIIVEDTQPVEYGEKLFRIEPS